MSAQDIIVIAGIIFLIPKLTETYLKEFGFTRQFRLVIMLGGFLWVAISCGHNSIHWVLGTADSDAHKFASWWYPDIVRHIESENFKALMRMFLSQDDIFMLLIRGFFITIQG